MVEFGETKYGWSNYWIYETEEGACHFCIRNLKYLFVLWKVFFNIQYVSSSGYTVRISSQWYKNHQHGLDFQWN